MANKKQILSAKKGAQELNEFGCLNLAAKIIKQTQLDYVNAKLYLALHSGNKYFRKSCISAEKTLIECKNFFLCKDERKIYNILTLGKGNGEYILQTCDAFVEKALAQGLRRVRLVEEDDDDSSSDEDMEGGEY